MYSKRLWVMPKIVRVPASRTDDSSEIFQAFVIGSFRVSHKLSNHQIATTRRSFCLPETPNKLRSQTFKKCWLTPGL